MSDPYVTRQEPTEDSLISNGDPDMALHYVDRLNAGIDSASKEEVIDALRFWVGEADYYKNTRADSSLVERTENLLIEIDSGFIECWDDVEGYLVEDGIEDALKTVSERIRSIIDEARDRG